MSASIGTFTTSEWTVEYMSDDGRFDTYQMSAYRAEVTSGGALLFYDKNNNVIRAASPSGWTQVTPA